MCGRLEEAVSDFKEAVGTHTRRGSERVGDAYAGLGDVYRERGDCSLAAAAYFTLRAAQDDAPIDAIIAGLLAGVALGIKPSNAPFLAGAGLALLIARRWRGIVTFAAIVVRPDSPVYREARVAASLLHPNIVMMFNAFELEQQLVMTTEVVEQ